MQTLVDGTKGLSLLVTLQWDRILYLGAVSGALAAGAWLCSLYLV